MNNNKKLFTESTGPELLAVFFQWNIRLCYMTPTLVSITAEKGGLS